MDANQEAQLNMERTVEEVLDDHVVVTDTVPAVKNVVAVFKAVIVKILAAVQSQGKQIGGIRTDKGKAKEAMCQMATDMAGFGAAYANETGNETLEEELNYSMTDLMRLRDDEAGPICMGIHDILEENKVALVDYGVTDGMLVDFKKSITLYEGMVPDVRKAEVAHGLQTASIDTLLRSNAELLNKRLDKLMPLFKNIDADFVDLYYRARVLVDPKHITTALRVTVIDEVTNLEVANPKLTIIETGDIIAGDASGIILWKPAQNGDFTYEVVATGYDTFSGSVHTKLGSETALAVKMKRTV